MLCFHLQITLVYFCTRKEAAILLHYVSTVVQNMDLLPDITQDITQDIKKQGSALFAVCLLTIRRDQTVHTGPLKKTSLNLYRKIAFDNTVPVSLRVRRQRREEL